MGIKDIIVHYIAICISIFIFCKIYEKYSDKKITLNKTLILKIMGMAIICFLNNMFMPVLIRAFSSAFLNYLMFKLIFKDKTKKTIYYTIVIVIFLYITELLVSIFLPLWIKDVTILNSSLWFKMGFSLFVYVLLYFILTNKMSLTFYKKLESIIFNSKYYYILLIIAFIVCNLWIFYSGLHLQNKVLNIAICLTEITIVFLLLNILTNKYKKHILEIKETQLKQDLELYSKVASEYKELKHNLMNDFLIIKSKLPKKEQPFINEVINKYKSNYEWVNSVTDIPEGLQGLVFLKKNQAELKNIHFNLEYNVNKKMENTFEINNNFKLYETLGILFDNAIEGASESKEKIINVVFSCSKTSFIINIMNTFSNDIDLEKIGNKDYSTKNRGSGIGLNYIKKQKNKFKIKQTIINNIFSSEIIINKNEKIPKKKSR